jgi:cell division transport system ATP-binding protein
VLGEGTTPPARTMRNRQQKKDGGGEPRRPRVGGAPIIELRDVTKVYPGGHMALDRVSLAINRGEFAFLVGPTGCGKSTFIKLLPDRTVHDNVAYALQVIGAPRSEIRRQVPEILRLVGLSTKLHSYPDQLSGGEQQRVSIARAFVNHPPLLLADEPSGNLDPVTSIGVMQLLYRINKTGTTVVVVTHDREMVDNMRRRVIELYEGRVVRDEVSGGYTEESTTEFGLRMKAEMGVGSEGGTNGHDTESLF